MLGCDRRTGPHKGRSMSSAAGGSHRLLPPRHRCPSGTSLCSAFACSHQGDVLHQQRWASLNAGPGGTRDLGEDIKECRETSSTSSDGHPSTLGQEVQRTLERTLAIAGSSCSKIDARECAEAGALQSLEGIACDDVEGSPTSFDSGSCCSPVSVGAVRCDERPASRPCGASAKGSVAEEPAHSSLHGTAPPPR